MASLNGIQIESNDAIEHISCIISWPHPFGEEAHCLARLIIGSSTAPIVAVLSEIASNPDELGITGDFPAVAAAFMEALSKAGRDVDPAQVIWIAHHGWFSSYDPAGPETFTEIPLVFDGQHYQGDLSWDKLLTSGEVMQRVKPLELKPVEQVLNELNHPR